MGKRRIGAVLYLFQYLESLLPAANIDESGNYNRISKYSSSSDPKQNPCQSGDEPQGALFKVENYEFGSSKGAIIFLGGTTSEHILPENIKSPSIRGGG